MINRRPVGGRTPLIQTLKVLGLTPNLVACLDFGDANCYVSGQTVTNTGGTSNDWLLGALVTAGADDPTFTGTPGALSSGEYFAFDGGDILSVATANPAEIQTFHKDNAKATIAAWYWPASSASSQAFMGNAATAQTGFFFSSRLVTTALIQWQVRNAGAVVIAASSTLAVVDGVWNFIAVSLDEAAGTGTFQVNGAQESFVSTYSSPAAGDATNRTGISTRRGTQFDNGLANGSRVAQVGVWGSSLSNSALNALYDATRARFNR